jgi:hypothetical protein
MKWEYRTEKFSATGGFLGGKFNEPALTATLNEAGGEGWELVTAFVTHQGYGQSREVCAILKRERR